MARAQYEAKFPEHSLSVKVFLELLGKLVSGPGALDTKKKIKSWYENGSFDEHSAATYLYEAYKKSTRLYAKI